ncbi:MAG: hypothetical protein ACD_12C00780G0003 [uncultured bacterium]|nr:MAG: hypothetical protein ACD_12C00780G0003 [uncultured bacterium]
MQYLDKKWQKAFFQGVGGLSCNLSAGYFGVIIIFPFVNKPSILADYMLLIFNIAMGILLLVLTIIFERRAL